MAFGFCENVQAQSPRKYREIRIPVQLSKDHQAEGIIRLPIVSDEFQTLPIRFPILLIFGGFENAAEVLNLVQTKAPVALGTFDYPYKAPRKMSFSQVLKNIPETKKLFPLTVGGITDFIKKLKHHPEIDSTRLLLLGASFGAPFTIAAAKLTPEVAGLVVVHGFGLVPLVIEQAILRSWLPKYGWISKPLAWLLARLSWIYLNIDLPETYARQLAVHQKVLLIEAERDSFIPQAARLSLWKAVQQSKCKYERVILDTDHLMPGSNKLILQLINIIQAWMTKENLFLKTPLSE